MAISKTKKEEIIENAVRLFIEHGYDKASMRDLAKASGIKAPGIYHHFKSKEEILQKINEECLDKFRVYILSEIEKQTDPEEKIKAYISNMIKYQFLLGEFVFILDDRVTVKYLKRRREMDQYVMQLLRDIIKELAKEKNVKNGVDPTVCAFTLYSMLSHFYKWFNPKGRISIDELTNQMIQFFFHGFYLEPDPVKLEKSKESDFL